MGIEELRKRLDEIDRELEELITKRIDICKKIGEIKAREGRGELIYAGRKKF